MDNFDYLKTTGASFELVKIPLVHTAKETAAALNCKLELILKSMLVFDSAKQDSFALFIIPGNKQLDFQRINELCGYGSAKFYPPGKIQKKTGFKIGTLPPWGYSSDIVLYYDIEILKQNVAYAGSGNSRYLIKFDPNELNKDFFAELTPQGKMHKDSLIS